MTTPWSSAGTRASSLTGDKTDPILTNTVEQNDTSGVEVSGILLFNVSGGEAVENNTVLDNGFNGIAVDSTSGIIAVDGTTTGAKVSGNDVENNGGDGIVLNGTTGSIFAANTLKNNARGDTPCRLVVQRDDRERCRQQQGRRHPPRRQQHRQHRDREHRAGQRRLRRRGPLDRHRHRRDGEPLDAEQLQYRTTTAAGSATDEALLDRGWTGTSGDLCVAVGRTRRSGRVIGRLVKGDAKRHPHWPHTRVVSRRTGRPAYEG